MAQCILLVTEGIVSLDASVRLAAWDLQGAKRLARYGVLKS